MIRITLTLTFLLSSLIVPSPAQQSQATNEKAARYHEALQKRPGSGYLFERFYNAWLDSGSLDGLEDFLNSRNNGKTADALILGFYHVKQGNDQLAIETLDEALKEDPSFAAGWFEKAKISARNSNFEGAISDLGRALETNPDTELKIEISKFKGRLLIGLEETEAALTLFQQLLADFPEDEDLHEDLIELQIDEGLFEEAIESLKALIAKTQDPYRQVSRQVRLGDVYQRLEKRAEALAAYESGLRKTGSGAWIEKEILAQIEQVFRREDDLTGLASLFEKLAAAEGPMRPGLIQRRAGVLVELRKTNEAIELFNDLLARTPGNREIRENYVELLRQAGQPGKAAVQIKELINQNPEDAELLITLAILQNEAKQTDEALEALRTFLAKAGESDSAWLRVARLQENFGRLAEAEATLRDLIARNPDEVANRETFAAFLHRVEKRGEAIEIWKDLAAAGEPEMALRTARALVSRQENEAAFEVLRARSDDLRNNLFYLARLCEVAIRLEKFEEAVEWALRRVQLADQAVDLTPALREGATILIQSGKVDEVAEELAAKEPKTDQDRCLLAEIYEQRGQLYQIDELLAGDSALLASQRIRIRKLRGDWKSAAEETRDLLLATSGRMRSSLLRELVSLYVRAGLPAEAAKWIPEWKRASPGSIEPWLKEAAIAELRGDDPAAAEVLEAAARKFDENVEIRSRLARAYRKAGQNADARRIYTNLYDESEQLADKLRWIQQIAIIALEEEKIDSLIDQFEERRRNNRGSVAPLLALAEIHRTSYDFTERRKALMEASQMRSDDVDLILQIALIEEHEGEWRDALRSLERARALEDSPRIVQRIAAIQLQYGKSDAETMRRLRELGAEAEIGSFLQLALAIANRRDWEQLKRFVSSRVEEFPNDYRVHFLRALALEELSENPAAADAYLRVLEIQEELPASARAGLRPGTKPGSSWSPPNYGRMPAGMTALMDYASEAAFAYFHRLEDGGVILPNKLDSAHNAALAHLAQLMRLDEKEASRLERRIGSIAGAEAVVLTSLDFDPEIENAPLWISEEVLAENPENAALHACWLCKNAMGDKGKPGPFELYQNCFRLFESDYPGYAIQSVFEAIRYHRDESKAMLGSILRVLEENPAESFGLPTIMALLKDREKLNFGDEQSRYLEERFVELYPKAKNRLTGHVATEAFHRMAEILGKREDPARYVAFLESRIAEVRRSPQPFKIPAGSSFLVNLLKPLPFPPADLNTFQLNRFPKEVIELTARDEHRLELPSWYRDPPKEKFEAWFEVVQDPILKFLIAVRIGKDRETLEAIAKELEADPSVDRIARAQLLAAWRARIGDHAKVVAMLQKSRQLPIFRDLRNIVDVAIVNSAIQLDRNDEALAPLIQAGGEATLRLASTEMKPSQRMELISAMRTLGLESAAEKEEEANITVEMMTRRMYFDYFTSSDSSNPDERIAKLLEAGERSAAVRETVYRMRSLIPNVFDLQGFGGRGRLAADAVAREAEKIGLDEEVLEFFRTKAPKNDIRRLEYAGAAILFKKEDLAIEPIKTVVENNPDNANLKSLLSIMLIQRDEDAGRVRELLASMRESELASFAYVLNQRIPAGSVPLKDELRFFETLLPFIANYYPASNVADDWIVIYLKRLVGPWKTTDDVNLGRLYRQLPDADFPKEVEEATARRWRIHDRMVEDLWKVPQLAELAFECESAGALARGIDHDPASKARQVLLTLKDLDTAQRVPQDALHSLSVPGPAEVLVREAFRKNDRGQIDQELLDEIGKRSYGQRILQLLKDLTAVHLDAPDSQLVEIQRRFPVPKANYDEHFRNYGLTIGRSIAPLYRRIRGEEPAANESGVASNGKFRTLIAHSGGVFEYDEAMNEIWSYPADYPYNVQRLPNGNTLIAERGKDRVIEVSPAKEIVRQLPVEDVNSARQLPSGNWLMATDDNGALEIDPQGEVVSKIMPWGRWFIDAIRLENGATLVAEYYPGPGYYAVAEYDSTRKIVWEITDLASIDTIQLLENGNVLVCDIGGRIIEFDRKTKGALWALEVENARAAHRIENGNLLIVTQKPDNRFIVMTPEGEEVWSKKIENGNHGRFDRFEVSD